MTKPIKAKIDRSLFVPIVGDAAIASVPITDGRLIPVLIIDVSARPEVAELIRVHEHLRTGDVESRWASDRDNTDHVMLVLTFVRPMDVEVVLVLSIERQAVLVEGILTGGGVYLQIGEAGDRLATTMDTQRLLVEIPKSAFRQEWDRLFLDRMTVVISRRHAVSRRSARPAAERLVAEVKKLVSLRMEE